MLVSIYVVLLLELHLLLEEVSVYCLRVCIIYEAESINHT